MDKKTDLRIQKTQKALCDAFLVLLEEKRFENITVNELCDRAMVRRATFYKHFTDKYEFFGFFIRQTEESFVAEQKASSGDASLSSYYKFLFCQCINFFKEHSSLLDCVCTSSVFPTLLQIFSDEIYQHMLIKIKEDEARGLHLPINNELFASFFTGGIIHSIRYWYINHKPFSEEELSHEFNRLIEAFHLE